MISAVNAMSGRCLPIRLFAVAASLLLTTCSPEPPLPRVLDFSGTIMGTGYRITAVDVPEYLDRNALNAGILRAMESVNDAMSTYQEDSELSRFNRSRDTDWVAASPGLVAVLQDARRISELSAGAFDVTVGPLVNLWGFGPDPRDEQVPDERDIRTAMAKVGYRHVEVRDTPPAIKKSNSDLYIDLSAIAKGYAVDQVCDFLESQDIQNYLVDLGGDLRAKGHNTQRMRWRIGIEKPVPGERSIQQTVQLSDLALATSGNYRNYFEKDGKRYSHTIDPRTGRPIEHNLASASVAAATAMRADALATALMVLGRAQGLQLAEELDLAVLLIVKQENGYTERYTRKFAQLLTDK